MATPFGELEGTAKEDAAFLKVMNKRISLGAKILKIIAPHRRQERHLFALSSAWIQRLAALMRQALLWLAKQLIIISGC